MISTLYVGFGSAHGDDQIGWVAIDRLQERIGMQPGSLFIKCEKSPMDWVSQIPKSQRIIFVDAVQSGAPAGTIHSFSISSGNIPANGIKTSSHGLGIVESIALAQSLGDLPKDLRFYGIEMKQALPGSSLSLEAGEKMGALIDQINDDIIIPGLNKLR